MGKDGSSSFPLPIFLEPYLGPWISKKWSKMGGKTRKRLFNFLIFGVFLGNGSKPRLKKKNFCVCFLLTTIFLFFPFLSRSSDFCVSQRGTKEKYSSTVTDRLENRNLPMKVAKIYLAACCHSFRYFSRLIWFSCTNSAIFRPFFKVADFDHSPKWTQKAKKARVFEKIPPPTLTAEEKPSNI